MTTTSEKIKGRLKELQSAQDNTMPVDFISTVHNEWTNLIEALTLACEVIELRERQINIALETLEKYRTLVIETKNESMFRLGVHASDALNLMSELGKGVSLRSIAEKIGVSL